MAKGRAGTGWLVAVAVAMTVLVSTNVWNPFPDLWNWISTSGPIADPPARWQERLGGSPQHVALLEQHVVIEHRDMVEVRSRLSGRQIWQTPADWAAVAGPPARTVVVAGKLLVKGYQVIDPATGAVLRRDERAAAVWTFADYLLDVACRTPKDCQLTAREPASGDERWHVGLPGMGFVLFADNPELTGSAPPTADRIAERVEPQPMPQLLGFPIDGRVYVVDTAQGTVLPEVSPSRRERIIVLGGRVIHSEAVPRDGGCGVTVTGRDAVTGDEVWRWRDNQLGTITGGGCDQRHQPTGSGDLVLATTPDGRQALLDTGFGRQVLLCAPGERVAAVDGNRAVVRSADGAKFTGYSLDLESGGKPKALWNRKVNAEASAAIRGKVVIVVDRGPDRVIVLDTTTGKVRRQVDTDAEVVAADANGLLLGQRRDLGYLAFD
ncbi:hypothetical protein Cs7R123_37330 [Catellatospora sp. TT07R-123]|uniref:outer membrane protein assembly factor BamB family protein n=1 Tax=Catellatospora sp. TT07R-123 TaxID=2733863 RepID=UPI001B0C2FE0|nr:PQQ-binding-like beta-propeller repeat protein [Catellatospora sp. TT07R-123]GHJ46391.1 hypothetical protein Cs7R123_37330 [Catellatospora sp. TT07R-123]